MTIRNTTLEDIASVVGFNATIRLSAWFGNVNNIFVPAEAAPGQLLVKLIGMSAAQKLSATWPQEHIAVPTLRQYDEDERLQLIKRMLELDFTVREIARYLKISVRRIQQLCRELERAGLMMPVAPKLGPPPLQDSAGFELQRTWQPAVPQETCQAKPARQNLPGKTCQAKRPGKTPQAKPGVKKAGKKPTGNAGRPAAAKAGLLVKPKRTGKPAAR